MEKIIEGSWPADDIRRAFVAGARWWEFESQGATMWPSDRNKAENKAETRYPGGSLSPATASREDVINRIKECIPANPYPETIFVMTIEDYVKVLPDSTVRTAVSGFMGRLTYNMAVGIIIEAIEEEFQAKICEINKL